MIDLHSHTTASDGQHSPDVLFTMAAAAGVKVLSVTDHDTVAGLVACEAAAAARGLRLVPGIELSAFINGREVHVLGHFVDRTDERLKSFQDLLTIERIKRMELMVEKLKGMGFPVTMAHVRAMAGDDAVLARPHLARVMVEFNWCVDTREAFHRFLGDGKPAAVPRYQLSALDAVAMIHQAHGTATIAHPGVSKVEKHELKELKAAGLDGLEIIHSDHPPSQREKFNAWAKELDLCGTAGSDFHGEKVAPDRLLGSVSMTEAELAALERRRR
jgi:predicted metal-dependent phosphoesterase TrpH